MQAKGLAEVDKPMHLVLVADFWKYPLLTISLLVMTLIAAFAWQKYGPRCVRKVANWIR